MKSKIKIITSMLIFGSIGIFVKNISLSSIEIAFMRAVTGSLFLIFAGFLIKHRVSFQQIKKNLPLLILSGAAIGFNWILLFQAYKYTTVSNATLSYYFAPIFVIVLSPFILKEKLSPLKVMCILTAMVGLFLIVDIQGTASSSPYNHITGVLFGLSAAVLYASAILMNKFIKDLSSFDTTIIQLMTAALVLLPGIALQGGIQFSNLSTKAWLLVIIVGIIHTGVAYFLYFTSIKDLKSHSIAILSYIDPISAVVFAALFLGETMFPLQVLGGILILGSTFLSERAPTKKND